MTADIDMANVTHLALAAYRERDLDAYDRWMPLAVEGLSERQWAALVAAMDELDELHGVWYPKGA